MRSSRPSATKNVTMRKNQSQEAERRQVKNSWLTVLKFITINSTKLKMLWSDLSHVPHNQPNLAPARYGIFGTIHHFNAAGNILYKIKLNFISFVDFKDSDQIFSGCHKSEVKVPIAQLWNHDAFLNYQYFKSKKRRLIVMKYVVILSCAKLMTQYPHEKAVKIMERKI